VVHHAVHDIIEPVLDKSFIYHSYACRKNRGSHKAVDKAQEFLRRNAFCFHGDIKKYFFSIDHGILKEIINRRIEDKDLLWLINEIIDSAKQLAAEDPQFKTRGLPIGNLTSQFFANLYLSELDYFVKFDLKAKFYLRYMDDVMIFGNDKAILVGFKSKIRDFLKERLRLDIHEAKSQIYKSKNGIKFLGFRLFKGHRRLASSNVRRFKKRLKNFGYLLENNFMDKGKVCDSVRCWAAHSNYANTEGLRLNIYENLGKKRPYLSTLLKGILLDNKFFRERERERERERKKQKMQNDRFETLILKYETISDNRNSNFESLSIRKFGFVSYSGCRTLNSIRRFQCESLV